jgi:fatty-acyl-CoA synthase
MGRLLQLGDILATNAYLFPEKVGARDLTRSLTFRVWNERACKLANALLRTRSWKERPHCSSRLQLP